MAVCASRRAGAVRLKRGGWGCWTVPGGYDGRVSGHQGRADGVGQEEGGCTHIMEGEGIGPRRGLMGITALL